MVANFGEFFPPEFQAEQRERNIRPGAVFKVYVTNTNPPKYKRIVILGINEDETLIGHLFINTSINLWQLDSDELRNLQIELLSDGRDYLDHDSFLDCSDLRKFSLEGLQQLYAQDLEIFFGTPFGRRSEQRHRKSKRGQNNCTEDEKNIRADLNRRIS